jgi:hypothetical protein
MSCSSNSNKLGQSGGLKAGISSLGSKAGRVAGSLASQVNQATVSVAEVTGRTVAPVSNRVLAAVDRPTTIAANLVPAVAAAAVYAQVKVSATGPQRGRRPAVAVAVGLREGPDLLEKARTASRVKKGVGLAALAGGLTASIAADVTAQPGGERTLVQRKKRFLLGERQVEVAFTQSSLTRFLNRRDLMVSRQNVVASSGDMVHHGSATWHRGTTVIKTPQGQRTITHLRKLGLPSASYYFERSLSDQDVAALVSGQRPAHQMTGYVGTIGAMENLAPSWGQAKRAMILTRLHWPTTKSMPSWVKETEPGQAAGAAEPVVIRRPPVKAKVRRAGNGPVESQS